MLRIFYICSWKHQLNYYYLYITAETPGQNNGVVGISNSELWRHLWCCRKMVWFVFLCSSSFYFTSFVHLLGWGGKCVTPVLLDHWSKAHLSTDSNWIGVQTVFTGSIPELLRNLWFQHHLKPTSCWAVMTTWQM